MSAESSRCTCCLDFAMRRAITACATGTGATVSTRPQAKAVTNAGCTLLVQHMCSSLCSSLWSDDYRNGGTTTPANTPSLTNCAVGCPNTWLGDKVLSAGLIGCICACGVATHYARTRQAEPAGHSGMCWIGVRSVVQKLGVWI